jgi:hypothetical protein
LIPVRQAELVATWTDERIHDHACDQRYIRQVVTLSNFHLPTSSTAMFTSVIHRTRLHESSFKAGFTLSSGFSKRINQRSESCPGIRNNVACIHDSFKGIIGRDSCIRHIAYNADIIEADMTLVITRNEWEDRDCNQVSAS